MARLSHGRLRRLMEGMEGELDLDGVDVTYKRRVVSTAAALTLTAQDSGKLIIVSQAAGYTITLPSDAAGLHFKFVLGTAGSNDVKIDGGSSNAVKGFNMDPTTGINAVDNNMVQFASGVSVVGDVVRLENDGTTWWVESFSSATNGIVGTNS